MNNFHVRWVPHQLTSDVRATRLAKFRELLPMLEPLRKNNFGRVVTEDDGWFYLETEHSAQWSICHDDVAPKTNPIISSPKFMLAFLWAIKGFHAGDLMTSQNQFNSQYMAKQIVMPFV
jgi:hypothetical protein